MTYTTTPAHARALSEGPGIIAVKAEDVPYGALNPRMDPVSGWAKFNLLDGHAMLRPPYPVGSEVEVQTPVLPGYSFEPTGYEKRYFVTVTRVEVKRARHFAFPPAHAGYDMTIANWCRDNEVTTSDFLWLHHTEPKP